MKKKLIASISIITLIVVIAGCANQITDLNPTLTNNVTFTPNTSVNTFSESPYSTPSVTSDINLSEVKVHFIDVGQADAIFIDYGDIDILIDGGNNNDGTLVVNYLKSLNTDDIELLVATHPHEDHIGGLDVVINNFNVEKVLKPDLAENTTTNKDFELAIENKHIPTENPEQGKVYQFNDLKFIVLNNKNKDYTETNNFSIVLKMVYKNNSFIFTGDAEDKVEHDILQSNLDLKADVLKVGHHGSSSSTTALFLNKVKPDYAVISVEVGNKYGHPDNIVLERLNLHDIAILRTDELGTIVFTSNGSKLTFQAGKAPVQTPAKTGTANTPSPKPTTSNATSNNVVISALDKKAEYVEITNNSNNDVKMTGWYIISVTGNQRYNFPNGYVLKAKTKIKIASAGAEGDLIWTTANIWNNSSSDPAELYNNTGKLVSSFSD